MAEINIAGDNFNVLVEGDAAKPAVLLVNGLGTSLHMWDAQVPALVKEFQIIRYDGRGHGASVVTEGPYSIEGLAKDALAILDALGIGKAHFIGLSMGGFIGQWILCNAPERIGRAVLANTGAHIGSPDFWNSRINTIRESGLPAVADNVVERWFSKDFREAHQEVIGPVAEVLKQTSVEGYASACSALRDADLREAVRSIKAKVLIITSTYDAATPPELGEYLAQVIDGAKLVKLETGHLSNVEDARHFTEAVMEFLTAPETTISESTPALAKVSRRPRPVKRTLGTPIPQPTGSMKVAVKKSSTKTTLAAPIKAAPPPKAVIVPLPVTKKAPARKPVTSPAPIPGKPVTKAAATIAPAKTSPAAKAALPQPVAKAAASRSAAPAKAQIAKATTAKASAKKAVAEKAPVQKTAPARGTSIKTAAKPVAASKGLALAEPGAKKTAAPAPAAKSAAAAKSAPVKKAAAPAPAAKVAAPKSAPSKAATSKAPAAKAPAAKGAAAKAAPAKPTAVKAPAPKATAAKAAPVKAPARKATPSKTAPGKPASRPAR